MASRTRRLTKLLSKSKSKSPIRSPSPTSTQPCLPIESNAKPHHPPTTTTLSRGLFDPSSITESPSPLDAFPTLSLSLSPAPPSLLARYVHAHLPPEFTPADLLRFLRRRLRHHPRLSPYDLHVFLWAAALPSFRHDHSTYSFMVLRLASTARLPALRPLLRRALLSHPCPCSHPSIFSCPHLPPVLRAALQAFVHAGLLADAYSTLQDIKKSSDGRLGADFYNVLLSGYARNKQHENALKLYDEMLKDRVKPDVFTFNILIGSCCRNLTFASALDWFREMRSRGCEPNVVTFNTLIKGFFKEKKFKEGIGIAHEMLDLGCSLSVATCEILVNGLCSNGKVLEAGDLIMSFVRKGVIPADFDCLGLVEKLCNEGRAEMASELVHSLWEKGNDVGVVTCTTLIEGLRNLAKLDGAFGLMERMFEKEMVPDIITFNCLLEALCDVGRALDANRLRILGSRKGLEPDGMTFGILIRGFAREGRRREGEGVVDEMLDGGFITNIATYNQLMEGLRNGNEVHS